MIKNIIYQWIIREYKLKYLVFSVLSGILLALSFQKFNFFILAWVAFIPLIHCVCKKNSFHSLLYGFITGLTYSLISVHWMFSFLLENTKSFRDSFIISIILWVYMACYFSIWGFLLSLSKQHINKILLAFFACSIWICLEFLRNYILSGFPLNLLGYSQASFFQIIQIVDITGVYGISFVIMLVNIMLYFWLKYQNKKYLIYSILIIFSLLIYGFIRTHQFNTEYGEKITVGVVQPNIKQYKKWRTHYKISILNVLSKKAKYFEDKKVDMILYPETVLPGKIQNDEMIQKLIKDISAYTKLSLIGGKYHDNIQVYNSIFLVNRQGDIINTYKKNHLVIFGEYIPFKGLLNNLFSKFDLFDDFTRGTELQVFKFDNYILGINICSENFYPYLSRQLVLKGAQILTTHSNDSWCDGLFYPNQHFIMNVFRAVENRKSLIVAANTGISGVIDSRGKIIKKTKNEEQICFTANVYTNNYITIYDKIGDILVYICLFFTLIILVFVVFIKAKRQI